MRRIHIPCSISLLLLVLIALMSGCAHHEKLLNQGIVVNNTASRLTEIKVLHTPTNRFVSINQILPYETFSLGFFEKKMQGEKAVVSWKSDQSDFVHKREVILPVSEPSLRPSTDAMTLIYTIVPSGEVSVQMVHSL